VNTANFDKIMKDMLDKYQTQEMVDKYLGDELAERFDALDDDDLKKLQQSVESRPNFPGILESIQNAMVDGIEKGLP